MEYIELLKNDKVGYYVAIFVAGVTAILQLLKKTNEYLEQFHVNKKLARYSSLIESCDENTKEYKFLTNLRLMEMFKIATGINTTPLKSKFIMTIYDLQIFTVNELQRVHTFIDVSERNSAIGKYSIGDKIEVLWSSIIIILVSLMFFPLTFMAKLSEFKSFAIFMAISASYFLFMYGAGVPIRKAITYRRVKNKLIQKGLWEEPTTEQSAQESKTVQG